MGILTAHTLTLAGTLSLLLEALAVIFDAVRLGTFTSFVLFHKVIIIGRSVVLAIVAFALNAAYSIFTLALAVARVAP